ncbi:NUDIX hydrolase [Pseudoflavonifractor sp. An187]|uniref:NUDIX hydrolase n=1 Tax=Pseudoflavonifractor sp. An187 TaxID=1965578 RepID=UPI0026D5BFC6
MDTQEKWLEWAMELQSIAQAGLFYSKDKFDLERFERIRTVAAEMVSHQTELPLNKVKDLFCNETGYQTPKIDTRAAMFDQGKILLVQEHDGRWALPGGWCDVDVSVKENTIKEVKEEAGLDVTADKIIAVQDRSKHNLPVYPYGVCKIFVLCTVVGGHFEENIETQGFAYFSAEELPTLATEKTTRNRSACALMRSTVPTGRSCLIKAETLVGDVWEGSFYFETWCDMITLLYNNSFHPRWKSGKRS